MNFSYFGKVHKGEQITIVILSAQLFLAAMKRKVLSNEAWGATPTSDRWAKK